MIGLEFHEPKVLTSAECKAKAAAGTLELDGEDLVPLSWLWFRAEAVASHIERELRDEVVYLPRTFHTGPRSPVSLREPSGITLWEESHPYDAECARLRRSSRWVRFTRVDELFTRIGLHVADLGTPTFGTTSPAALELEDGRVAS